MVSSLSVISSNIRYDEPKDDVHCWGNRREILATCLLEYSPDILATQEGKLQQIRDIDDRLDGLTCIDEHRDWVESLMYPCIFFNPDTLTLLESGDIWLSDSPSAVGSLSFGSGFPRLCTWAIFEEGILAINVHLDNAGSDTRLRQTQVLLRQLERLRSRGDTVLLMGDFNESPTSGVRALINNDWPDLHDPWLDLGQAEESSHHRFYEAIDYGSRVDWILASNRLEAQEIQLDKTRSETGIFPSDHYILKARFRWTKRSS